MSDELIIAFGGFIVMAIAIVKPIINLNTNITELRSSIDSFKEAIQDLKDRTMQHGKEIEDVQKTLVNHEARITNLEK